jgi:hypothetical protein
LKVRQLRQQQLLLHIPTALPLLLHMLLVNVRTALLLQGLVTGWVCMQLHLSNLLLLQLVLLQLREVLRLWATWW